MKKQKEGFVEETLEQKQARWSKQRKAARGLARTCGIDLKKLDRERSRRSAEKERSRDGY